MFPLLLEHGKISFLGKITTLKRGPVFESILLEQLIERDLSGLINPYWLCFLLAWIVSLYMIALNFQEYYYHISNQAYTMAQDCYQFVF